MMSLGFPMMFLGRRPVAIIATVFVLAMVGGLTLTARAGVPDRAIEVASGKLGPQTEWAISLFGKGRLGDCWVTKVKERRSVSASTTCGISIPDRPWQLVAQGSTGAGDRTRSMLFFLTRRDLDRLEIRLVNHDRERVVEMKVHRLDRRAASKAGLGSAYGFAWGLIDGRLGCIERVIATSVGGGTLRGARSRRC
jgi:hypothetical protein